MSLAHSLYKYPIIARFLFNLFFKDVDRNYVAMGIHAGLYLASTKGAIFSLSLTTFQVVLPSLRFSLTGNNLKTKTCFSD